MSNNWTPGPLACQPLKWLKTQVFLKNRQFLSPEGGVDSVLRGAVKGLK